MIILHCGWPKTGTTSLQAVLFSQRELLARHDLIYPDRWRPTAGFAHHGIVKALGAPAGLASVLAELEQLAAANRGADVLIAVEGLSFQLLAGGDRFGPVRTLLETAAASGSVRCIWTLRRADELIRSIFLHPGTVAGRPSLAEAMRRTRLRDLFAGMREIGRLVPDTVYLEYDRRGGHNLELLGQLGLAADVVTFLDDEIRRSDKLNVGLTEKKLAALSDLKALSRRAEMPISRRAVLDAFYRGFVFEDDHPHEPVDVAMREELHERTLREAAETGFSPYAELFSGATFNPGPTRPSVNPNALRNADVERLVDFLTLRSAVAATPEPRVR
jgi:hypothetical protein